MSQERGEWTGSTFEQWKLVVRFLGERRDYRRFSQKYRVTRVSKMPAGAYDRPRPPPPQPMTRRGGRRRYPDLMIGVETKSEQKRNLLFSVTYGGVS